MALTLVGDLSTLAETVVLLLLFVFISTNVAVLVVRRDTVNHAHFRVWTPCRCSGRGVVRAVADAAERQGVAVRGDPARGRHAPALLLRPYRNQPKGTNDMMAQHRLIHG